MSKDLPVGERAVMEPISSDDQAKMDAMHAAVLAAIAGYDSGLVLSVLSQLLYSSMPGEQLTDDHCMRRMQATLGLLNIMRDGYSNRPRDPGSLTGCVADLTAIAYVGSRPIIAPALVYVLISTVANGRRKDEAESAVVTRIGEALDAFERSLGAT